MVQTTFSSTGGARSILFLSRHPDEGGGSVESETLAV